MVDFLILVHFPPHPIEIAMIVMCSILWGLQARLRMHPYLLAFQAMLVAGLFARTIIGGLDDNASFYSIIETLTSTTAGQAFMFYATCYLIIRVLFSVRLHNANTRIFTRNRRS